MPAPQTVVSSCPMPAPLPDDGDLDLWIIDLHGAIIPLVEHTNTLGLSLLDSQDFDAGWEDREPVVSALGDVLSDLDAIDSIAVAAFQDAGATFSEDSGWTYPKDVTLVPMSLAHLEELHGLSLYYIEGVLPAFFEMRSQGTAISYFNGGGETSGPCGMTKSSVLLIDTIVESATATP